MKNADIVGLAIVALGIGAGVYLYVKRDKDAAGVAPPYVPPTITYAPPPEHLPASKGLALPAGNTPPLLGQLGSTMQTANSIVTTGKTLFTSIFG